MFKLTKPFLTSNFWFVALAHIYSEDTKILTCIFLNYALFKLVANSHLIGLVVIKRVLPTAQ